jgi:type I restriction enzyme S subunit
MPKINGETVRNLLVNIPPLPEQRRIVAKLDSLQARSRRAKEALDAIPPLLERLRQSVLAAAFRGDLTAEWRAKNPEVEPATELVARCPAPGGKSSGRAATKMVTPGRYAISVGHPGTEPPSGWAWVLLGSIARMESGHTPSREHAHYWSGGIPWIGIKDAREAHGATITTTSQTVSTEGLANSAARLLPAGTVCLSRTASVGYVTMMGRAMATSQDFANWVCGEALLPEYLMYALLAEGDGLREFGEGSTHTTIYFPELKALHLCLPPLAEQAEIVRALRDRLARVERLAQAAAETRELAPGLDRAILAKAFRGELVPQDPRESLEVEAPHPVVPLRSGEGQVVASPRAKGTKKRR